MADMAGTRVVGVLRDDAPSPEAGGIAEAKIYPESLRSVALSYLNDGGPSSLWKRGSAQRPDPCADYRQYRVTTQVPPR